ncbi:MAG: Intracellular exo-alpha-(1-_5)-L-arabinofuranosidase [candidate division BRC1 bacterium ADurb.BinA364]|nr:MAG: Intracellular exo-alpha-(1->5)-L-arabinofuranosidase [candidate division BRC1 bacterium ADurb.BinA364]
MDVEPGQRYVASLWIRNLSGLAPMLRISDMSWQTIASVECIGGSEWSQVHLIFDTGGAKQIRFQIFGGWMSESLRSAPGETLCDDAVLRKAGAEDLDALRQCRIVVDASKPGREINPLFFGANALFMVEDDQARADPKLERLLREMPIKLLRYPGGEMADNFHWKTNLLNDNTKFPFREGPDTTDTDEFMAWSRSLGAEPIFVANLESGYINGDLDAAIREAADWVRYCNIEKGYGVKYWEIGNESYLQGTYYPLRARQYAEAVVRFAQAMKAVDPTILIGAIGPHDINGSNAVEGLDDREILALLPFANEARRAEIDRIKKTKGAMPPPDKWWPTVVEIAGAAMDFAVVHRYYPNDLLVDTRVAESIEALKAFLSERLPGRDIPIALTEWNSGKNTRTQGATQMLLIAELAGEYIRGGVELATFWPLRNLGPNTGYREAIDRESSAPRASYFALSAMGQAFAGGGTVVHTRKDKPSAWSFAALTAEDRRLVVAITNKTLLEGGMQVDLALEGFEGEFASGLLYSANPAESEKIRAEALECEPVEGGWRVELKPYSLAILKFEKR